MIAATDYYARAIEAGADTVAYAVLVLALALVATLYLMTRR